MFSPDGLSPGSSASVSRKSEVVREPVSLTVKAAVREETRGAEKSESSGSLPDPALTDTGRAEPPGASAFVLWVRGCRLEISVLLFFFF